MVDKFAMIVEDAEMGQIVVMKEYDADEDADVISFTHVAPSLHAQVKLQLAYSCEEARDDVFKTLNTERVIKTVKGLYR